MQRQKTTQILKQFSYLLIEGLQSIVFLVPFFPAFDNDHALYFCIQGENK